MGLVSLEEEETRRDGRHGGGWGGCAGQRVWSAGAATAPATPSAAPAAAGRSYGGWARRSSGVPYGRRVPEPGLAHLCPVQVTPTAGPPRPRPFLLKAGAPPGRRFRVGSPDLGVCGRSFRRFLVLLAGVEGARSAGSRPARPPRALSRVAGSRGQPVAERWRKPDARQRRNCSTPDSALPEAVQVWFRNLGNLPLAFMLPRR